MPSVTEYFYPGGRVTMTVEAGQTVVGGNLVALTDDRIVRPAAADSVTCIGVALHDAAAGEKVAVATVGVWPLKAGAGGAVTQGARVGCDAAGTFKPSPIAAVGDINKKVGIALADIANDGVGPVLLAL